MEKLSKEQLLALVFVAGTTAIADLESPIEQLAEMYHLSSDKEEKKALAAKFAELTTAYNTEAKSGVYFTDPKKVKVVAITTNSKNPTPGEVKTLRKPKDLSDQEKLEIIALLDAKELKRAEIAAKYNVHPSTISDIVAARNKANAPEQAAGTEQAAATEQSAAGTGEQANA